jgi:ABC transport system ATP-binding/permease protein
VAPLINAQALSKTFGAVPLFQNVSLNISSGERLGFIGPNGSGKSTLLQILAGRIPADEGEVAARKNLRLAYVAQQSEFAPDDTVRGVIRRALAAANVPDSERDGREQETLGRTGFSDFDAEAASLSGGWRKRLAIAEAIVSEPEILFLDEPTNHLDIEGIAWLERVLTGSRFASIVVSHDRYFLENVATHVAELNRMYPEGILRVEGNYSEFLQRKDEFLAAESKRQDALQNRVRTELEWLRRGPKARATKAKARIDNAHELIAELGDIRSRRQTSTADIEFTTTERKTKRLVEFDNVSFGYENRRILTNYDFVFTAGTRVGLVGPNGSGKTTLLRLLKGELEPTSGEIRRAQNLRIVYFDQNRPLDESLTLRQALAGGSDSVVYRERTIHVAAWASRFLFTNEQLNQPVARLSGGERARVLIARLMLEPADLLLLDEPTNDLDIPTLELLEESLLEFAGALVLVTHDRFMLDRVSTLVLGLDGESNAERFSDYSQWAAWQNQKRTERDAPARAARSLQSAPAPAAQKKKLSYMEAREMDSMEERIATAEQDLQNKRTQLEDPAVFSDPKRLQAAYGEVESAQADVDRLYERWAELETR